jgi:hypothetical protein
MTTSSLSERGVAPSDRVVLRAAASRTSVVIAVRRGCIPNPIKDVLQLV